MTEAPDGTTAHSREFIEALNRHGFAFQHAVLKRADELRAAYDTEWTFEASEFPVQAGGNVTHVDLILRIPNSDTYLVGECKRVDPAMGRWCFARAPYTKRNPRPSALVFEELIHHKQSKLGAGPLIDHTSNAPYHIGVELRASARGDGSGSVRDNIDRSVAQVLRGVNGLANHFYSKDWASLEGRRFRFIPAIFTTAELWVADIDLRRTDLTSGRIAPDGVVLQNTGWLWFNYNLSPHLRHEIALTTPPKTLSDALTAESTRSVAIVSPKGIDDFLSPNQF